MMKNCSKKHIPIFFSSDDNYLPYLDIAIASLIENASKDYEYRIIILNTGLDSENIEKVKSNEQSGFTIDFFDISEYVEDIRSRLKNVYHFSVVTYYRLFIASLFPEYEKIIYLDCDIVVLGDISKLYNIDLKGNIFGAAPEQFVQNTRNSAAMHIWHWELIRINMSMPEFCCLIWKNSEKIGSKKNS